MHGAVRDRLCCFSVRLCPTVTGSYQDKAQAAAQGCRGHMGEGEGEVGEWLNNIHRFLFSPSPLLVSLSVSNICLHPSSLSFMFSPPFYSHAVPSSKSCFYSVVVFSSDCHGPQPPFFPSFHHFTSSVLITSPSLIDRFFLFALLLARPFNCTLHLSAPCSSKQAHVNTHPHVCFCSGGTGDVPKPYLIKYKQCCAEGTNK